MYYSKISERRESQGFEQLKLTYLKHVMFVFPNLKGAGGIWDSNSS